MAIDATFVLFGMFPPIMRTRPNSPIVWAKERTIPVIREDFIDGNNTFVKVTNFDFPRTCAASNKFLGILEKPA